MGRGRGTPAGLNAQVLRQAVLEVADTEGLDAVSVRNVARHLGVEAMSIYHWYPNKDALLAAAWDEVVCRLDPDALSTQASWQDYAGAFADQLRDQLLRHPNALPIMLGRHVSTPESMTVIDRVVASLHQRGLSYASAVDVVNTLSMFTMAHALNEYALPRRQTPAPDPEAHPALCAALAEGIPSGAAVDLDHFRRGVAALVNAAC
ncbi:TetR/AcrR family transcriptional regulator [Luteococcus sp. H138]|uniref:TetR/AcrR family transcriptional regulator n=1 Tax=unclassified Luteococcus TaxID=2639923 RepID=UPI00313F024E